MNGWGNYLDSLAPVQDRARELKTQMDANLAAYQKRARGALAKRVLDPGLFRVTPGTDLSTRTELLRHTGLLQQLKNRNQHHIQGDLRRRAPTSIAYPANLQVAVTTECNLRCKMCAITAVGKRYQGSHADPDLFKRIEPVLPFLSGIKLQGTGEPFLYPGMKQACELSMKHGVELLTVTNATVIDDEIARAVIRGFSEIFVSIDAASPDLYKHIRCGAKLRDVQRGLDFINKYRSPNLRLGFAFAIMKDNVHELPDLVRMAQRFNVQVVRCSWLVPMDELPWTYGQEPLAHAELMARWFAEARAVAKDLGVHIELPPMPTPTPAPAAVCVEPSPPSIAVAVAEPSAEAPAAPPVAPRKPSPPTTSVITQLRGRRVKGTCSLMYSNAYIHRDGTVAPCCFLKTRVGSLSTADFRSIWNGEEMQKLRAEFNGGTLPNACTGCAFLRMERIGDAALVD
jgi:MoaA/NifB/PqqE/SkfB family radical SAM enzyme